MYLPPFILERLQVMAHRVCCHRGPDFIVGGADTPYLKRWWLLPRNRVFNVYLHCFLRSDDDRALHDHPWPNASILLHGRYIEHTIAAGGINRRIERSVGNIKLRLPTAAHRIELFPDEVCWTLFLIGPRLRHWGFHCPDRWVPWREFVAADDPGSTGPGCGA